MLGSDVRLNARVYIPKLYARLNAEPIYSKLATMRFSGTKSFLVIPYTSFTPNDCAINSTVSWRTFSEASKSSVNVPVASSISSSQTNSQTASHERTLSCSRPARGHHVAPKRVKSQLFRIADLAGSGKRLLQKVSN